MKIDVTIPEAFSFLFKPSRYKVAYGGRGAGKSHNMAAALVIMGAQRPIRWLMAREIQKSLSASVHQLLCDKITLFKMHGQYSITRDGIRNVNGTHFLFAGLRTNPDSIKSMEGLDGAWIEESNMCSQRSLDLLLPTVRKPGSEIWFGLNRAKTTDPVDVMFLSGKPPPDTIIKNVNWYDNPYFPKVLYDEMMWLKNRDRDKWLHVWEGHPLSRSEAKVFNNWQVDDIDEIVPDECPLRYGADWGFAIDPTVLVGMYVWDRTIYIRHEAWKVKCAIDEIPSFFAGSDLNSKPRWKNPYKPGVQPHKGLPLAIKNRIVGDSARPETIAYMRQRGFNIVKATKGPGSIKDGIEFLQSFDIVIHPSCTHVIDEFGLYEYKVDKLTDEILSDFKDKDNHTIDAVRYALEEMRKKGFSGKPGRNIPGFGPMLVEG